MNPRPLGPEDSAKNSKSAFVPIWCCLFRVWLLSNPLRANTSIRSRRSLGQRLGQIVIALHKIKREKEYDLTSWKSPSHMVE